MFIQDNLKIVEETAKEFFEKMNFEVEIKAAVPEKFTIVIDLKTEEPQILIGEEGQTLMEIQRILKMILKRKIIVEGPFYIDLDINDYKKKKIIYLKETARLAADEVALIKKEKHLPAMPAYARRIIHLELSSRTDVVTESVGREPKRNVLIRPHP